MSSEEEDPFDQIDPALLAALMGGPEEDSAEISEIQELLSQVGSNDTEERVNAWESLAGNIWEGMEISEDIFVLIKEPILNCLVSNGADEDVRVVRPVVSILSLIDHNWFKADELAKLKLTFEQLTSRGDRKICVDVKCCLGSAVSADFSLFARMVATSIATDVGVECLTLLHHTIERVMAGDASEDEINDLKSRNVIIFLIAVLAIKEELAHDFSSFQTLLKFNKAVFAKSFLDCKHCFLLKELLIASLSIDVKCSGVGQIVAEFLSLELFENRQLDIADYIKKNHLLKIEGVKLYNTLVTVEFIANNCMVQGIQAAQEVVEELFPDILKVALKTNEVQAARTLGTILLCVPRNIDSVDPRMKVLLKLSNTFHAKSDEMKAELIPCVINPLLKDIKSDPSHDRVAVADVERMLKGSNTDGK